MKTPDNPDTRPPASPGGAARFLTAALLLLLAAACSPRHLVVDQMARMVHDGMTAFEADSDLVMVERAFPANIKTLEVMLASEPRHRELLVLLARLYGSYAFAFGEDRLEAATLRANGRGPFTLPKADADRAAEARSRTDDYYKRGLEYALRALEIRHPECRKRLKNLRTSTGFFEMLDAGDAPALFWYAFNLGGHVNLNRNSIRVLARAHLAEKAARRVLQLDPAYFNGGAHLFLMVYYASRPPMMGGNLQAAEDHHRTLRDLAGSEFLLTDLLFARFHAVQTGDRKAFERLLEAVTGAPRGPERYRLYNAVARKRAKRYLGAADRFFE